MDSKILTLLKELRNTGCSTSGHCASCSADKYLMLMGEISEGFTQCARYSPYVRRIVNDG